MPITVEATPCPNGSDFVISGPFFAEVQSAIASIQDDDDTLAATFTLPRRIDGEFRAVGTAISRAQWAGLTVSVNGGPPISWIDFVAANEGVSDEEFAAIHHALERDGHYRGGGGAVAEFTVDRA